MARERLKMRQVKEVLRLRFECGITSPRQIARATGCGRTTIQDYLKRAENCGVTTWAQIATLSETEIENLLFPSVITPVAVPKTKVLPDFIYVHQELKRSDHQVTLMLLWHEYKAENPQGYQYTAFTELYKKWSGKLAVSMRQTHVAGEKAFVDYCVGLFITDKNTGEKIKTELFVGVLGASSYTFAVASLTQKIPDWIDAHVQMYSFFNGVPQITVPDNLRSGIKSADRYEATINPSYREMSEHYGTCIIPARVRKPKDKGKVEAAVLVAQRWILAVLRNRVFYSVRELNEAIVELLKELNAKKTRHLKASRLELYESLDRPVLKALPKNGYEFAEWKKVRLNIDYHIEYDSHYYSAPYQLIKEELWCRGSHDTVEIFFKGKRVASHARSYSTSRLEKARTEPSHMPSSHRAHAEWTPSRIIEWAGSIGKHTAEVVRTVVESKAHPEQGYRSALGIIRLAKEHTNVRLEKACEKSLRLGSPSYQTIKTMLRNKMESTDSGAKTTPEKSAQLDLLAAINVRGSGYYN